MRLVTNPKAKAIAICTAAVLTFATASVAIAQVIRRGTVAAHSTDVWTSAASAGFSRVVVDGDGDTDLDCYVYDRFGTLLGADEDATDYCIVDIYQQTSGTIRVRIKNLGNVWNAYTVSVD